MRKFTTVKRHATFLIVTKGFGGVLVGILLNLILYKSDRMVDLSNHTLLNGIDRPYFSTGQAMGYSSSQINVCP